MQPPPVYHPLLSFSLSIPISLSLPPPVFTFFPRSIYSPFPRNTSIFFQIILDRFFRLFSLPVPCLSVSEESRDTWAAFCIIRTWFSGTVNTKKSLVATSRWRQASLSTSLNAFLDTCSSGNDFLLIVVRYEMEHLPWCRGGRGDGGDTWKGSCLIFNEWDDSCIPPSPVTPRFPLPCCNSWNEIRKFIYFKRIPYRRKGTMISKEEFFYIRCTVRYIFIIY